MRSEREGEWHEDGEGGKTGERVRERKRDHVNKRKRLRKKDPEKSSENGESREGDLAFIARSAGNLFTSGNLA